MNVGGGGGSSSSSSPPPDDDIIDDGIDGLPPCFLLAATKPATTSARRTRGVFGSKGGSKESFRIKKPASRKLAAPQPPQPPSIDDDDFEDDDDDDSGYLNEDVVSSPPEEAGAGRRRRRQLRSATAATTTGSAITETNTTTARMRLFEQPDGPKTADDAAEPSASANSTEENQKPPPSNSRATTGAGAAGTRKQQPPTRGQQQPPTRGEEVGGDDGPSQQQQQQQPRQQAQQQQQPPNPRGQLQLGSGGGRARSEPQLQLPPKELPNLRPRLGGMYPRSQSCSFLPPAVPKPPPPPPTHNRRSHHRSYTNNRNRNEDCLGGFGDELGSSEPGDYRGGRARGRTTGSCDWPMGSLFGNEEQDGFGGIGGEDQQLPQQPPPLPRRNFFTRSYSMSMASLTASGSSSNTSNSTLLLQRRSSIHGGSSSGCNAAGAGSGSFSTLSSTATTDNNTSSLFRTSSGYSTASGSSSGFGFGEAGEAAASSSAEAQQQQQQQPFVELPERKKIRARRKSIQGTVAPLSCEVSNSASFSHLAQSAQDWKRTVDDSNSPPSLAKAGSLSSSAGGFGFGSATTSSSSNGNTTSTSAVALEWMLNNNNNNNNANTEPPSSPSVRSVASSSCRKRGVCGSPLGSENGDLLLDGVLSQTTPTILSPSEGGGSRTSRARSRIYSPPPPPPLSVPTARQPPAAVAPMRTMMNMFPFGVGGGGRGRAVGAPSPSDERGVMDIDSSSSSDEDDNDSNILNDDDDDNTSRNIDDDDDISFTFHDDDSPSPATALHKTTISETDQDVLDTMPDYKDLNYLIFLLRQERRRNSHHHTLSGGSSMSWTVTPKPTWDVKRRASFMSWCATNMGFYIRSAGGGGGVGAISSGITYLQLSSTQANKVLDLCESARFLHKQQQEKQDDIPDDDNNNNHNNTNATTANGSSNKNNANNEEEQPSSFTLMSDTPMLSARKASPFPAASSNRSLCRRSSVGDSILGRKFKDESTEEISAKMSSLVVNDDDRKQPPVPSSQPPQSRSSTDSTSSSLVRLVTLEPQQQTSGTACIPRPSLDQEDVVGSRDMMMHMYPSDDDNPRDDRQLHQPPPPPPLRMSLASIPDDEDGCDFLSKGLGTAAAAGPPPRMSLQSVQSNTSNSSSSNDNNNDRTSLPYPAIMSFPSSEIMETPMPQQEESWGSRAVIGRDWGTSAQCPSSSLQILSAEIEERLSREAGTEREISESVPLIPLDGPGCSNLDFDSEAPDDMESESELVVESGRRNRTVRMMVDDDPSPSSSDNNNGMTERELRRRKQSIMKHRRMSVYMAASQSNNEPAGRCRQSSLFHAQRSSVAPTGRSRFGLDMEFLPSTQAGMEAEESLDGEAPDIFAADGILEKALSFLTETELLSTASLVSTSWADATARAHANLMLASLVPVDASHKDDDGEGNSTDESLLSDDDDNDDMTTDSQPQQRNTIAASMERCWRVLNGNFPTGQFLSQGGFKSVYKVFNASVGEHEAISVMDMHQVDPNVVAAELSVSCLLSSLTRRGICPNFVLTRGIFNTPYEPPASRWGSADQKKPKLPKRRPLRLPREPEEAHPGRYHYIRMELCNLGDAEEYTKTLRGKVMPPLLAQSVLFQCAFALHSAAEQFSMKHYDMKLLNIFLQQLTAPTGGGDVVLRYGFGSHVFALRMTGAQALLAKVADLGTANVQPESNGQPVTIAQLTTIENTPVDFMLLGDDAEQGHGHDNWGLGLCMLHLFTGEKPYEEIMEKVFCPPNLKKRLRRIWEDESVDGYQTICNEILSDVYKDEAGNIIDGEPDDTFYHTLYKYLVLFGIPSDKFSRKQHPLVWDAIVDCLEGSDSCALPTRPRRGRGGRNNNKCTQKGLDESQYRRDQRKFSIQNGNDKFIARARRRLKAMKGDGMGLLLRLCAFNPAERASAMDVLNHTFMNNLREPADGVVYSEADRVLSFTALSTHRTST